MESFMPLMIANARTSLQEEVACSRFDVCTDPARPGEVFLYEIYDDAAAFRTHLATDHFRAFDAAVTDMIVEKTVATYERVAA